MKQKRLIIAVFLIQELLLIQNFKIMKAPVLILFKQRKVTISKVCF